MVEGWFCKGLYHERRLPTGVPTNWRTSTEQGIYGTDTTISINLSWSPISVWDGGQFPVSPLQSVPGTQGYVNSSLPVWGMLHILIPGLILQQKLQAHLHPGGKWTVEQTQDHRFTSNRWPIYTANEYCLKATLLPLLSCFYNLRSKTPVNISFPPKLISIPSKLISYEIIFSCSNTLICWNSTASVFVDPGHSCNQVCRGI